MIDDLIQTASAASGLAPEKTRIALSAALGLMKTHADQAKLAELFVAVPGTQGLAEAGQSQSQGQATGLLGGVMKTFGGGAGKAMSDAMSLAQAMNAQGITNGRMKKMLPAAERWVREKTGRDLLREVLESIPGVGPLLARQEWAQG